MKKYSFTGELLTLKDGTILHRIKAEIDIPRYGVIAGDLGGWIEKEENLSQDGDAWVASDSMAYGNKYVCGRTFVVDNEDLEIYDDDELFLSNQRSKFKSIPFPYF